MLKLIKNKVLPILLIFTLVFTTMIFTGTPIKAYASEKGTSTIGFVNPLYEDLLSGEAKARYLDGDFEIAKTYKARSADSFNPDIYVTDIEDAADVLRKQIVQRKANPVTYLKTPATLTEADVKALCGELFYLALDHTGEPKEGDSLKFSCGGAECQMEWLTDGTNFYITFTYGVGYFTSAEQEAELDVAVATLKSDLNLDGKTDYEKVKAIYDYMTENITYDYDNLDDDSYMLKYTAYAALIDKTSVCQGYATLFYRLALEYGIDARIIAGLSSGERHSWNIVKLDGEYYLLDATWDAGRDEYSYFLKGTDNWEDHAPDAEYAVPPFVTMYPISADDYVVSEKISPFAGGDGTEANPYLIETKEQLDLVRYYLDASFKMIADIEFTEADFAEGGDYYNDGKGWAPIGIDQTTPFTGTFDGNGHKVSGLEVNLLDTDDYTYAGVFGAVKGHIKGLGVVESSFEGYYAGAIAGRLETGWIENCYSTSNVTSSTYAGGIVGYCKDDEDTLKASNTKISKCYNDGIVKGCGTLTYVGGIVGHTQFEVLISECYNRGNVIGEYLKSSKASYNAGGIAGVLSSSRIENSYNLGNVSAKTGGSGYIRVGGIAGWLSYYSSDRPSTAENCYSIGQTEADCKKATEVYTYELFGSTHSKTAVSNCYYSADNGTDKTGTALDLDQLRNSKSYIGFDFSNVWTISDKEVYQLPYFKWQAKNTTLPIEFCSIEVAEPNFYKEEAVIPKVTVTNGTLVLAEGKDYTLEYADNTGVGIGKVTITGVGNYTGKITKTFTIEEIKGYTVSGNVTSFLETDDDITVQLLDANGVVAYSVAVDNYTVTSASKKEYTSTFSIPEVADGTYTLVVSKANHTTREYQITVDGGNITQDVKIHLKGDITGDGKVNILDVNKANLHFKKKSTLTGYELLCGDVTGDKKVNILDVNKLNLHFKNKAKLW